MARKREIILAVGGFLLALVLIGGGLWWHARSGNGQQNLAEQTASSDQSSSDGTGGLNVSSGSASDLGQLGSNQSSNKSGGSGSGSGSGSSGSGSLDPSTFAQYDKYKNAKNALFADMQKGTGTALTAGRKATVYYRGWLTNGTLIDQSPVDSKGLPQPYMFTMGAHQVIPGWEEAMYNMKAGGIRMLIIPPAAAYGSKGQGAVPPNALLVFEVQLLKVQ